MQLVKIWPRCRASTIVLRALLPRAPAEMPKVPVTSKKAITVLSSEPLLPSGLQDAGQAPRRSSRLAGVDAHATVAQTTSKHSGSAETGAVPTQARSGQVKAEKVEAIAAAKDSSKGRKSRAGNSQAAAKPRGKKQADSAVYKVEDEAKDGGNDLAAAGPKKKKQKRTDTAKEGTEHVAKDAAAVATVDKIMASDPAATEKPKKNRRAPAGFAVRGEEVDDSAAARRARLKASNKRDTEPGEVPAVLGSEIQRICQELGNADLGRTAPWERSGEEVGGRRWWVGCHVSASGGLERAVINAAAVGCRAFALDTRSKLRWESPPLTEDTVAAFKTACKQFGYAPEQILPHGSYLINLASPDPEMVRVNKDLVAEQAEKGFGGFLAELQRCEKLGLTMYNFHPGSTTANLCHLLCNGVRTRSAAGLCSHEESMDRIAGFINRALEMTKGVTVVLENMASVGNIVGGRLWHLKYIIDRVSDKSRIGFCIDTCHLFSAGLDLRTVEACEQTFQEIDEVIGLQYLRGMHVNDSKTPFDSHRDRHENIGRGSIPLSTFRWIMNNPAFQGIPLIMETPVQEREPPLNFRKSLELGNIVWRDPDGPYGVGTDRRDVMVLNSFMES